MNAIFYMHLIATLVNIFFLGLLWWYNHGLININYQLIKDNREILVEAKKLQEHINNMRNR